MRIVFRIQMGMFSEFRGVWNKALGLRHSSHGTRTLLPTLRYSSKEQGEIAVIVAPVLRFVDVGFNASVRIEVGGLAKQL